MEISLKDLVYNHKSMTNVQGQPQFSMKHSHNNYEIIFFEHGNADYVIEGNRYELKSGDLIFTRPLAYHYIEIKSHMDYVRYNIAFDAEYVGQKLLDAIPSNIEIVNCTTHPIIFENFRKMDYYGNKLNSEMFIDVLACLLKEILINLSQITRDEAKSIPSELSPIITRALEFINQNLFEIAGIKEVCQNIGVSEPYFFTLFKSQMKIPPKQYINLKRIQSARQMIRCGRKPGEIFADCGFASYVGFYKQYIKIFGYPPSHDKL